MGMVVYSGDSRLMARLANRYLKNNPFEVSNEKPRSTWRTRRPCAAVFLLTGGLTHRAQLHILEQAPPKMADQNAVGKANYLCFQT